jgi:hypothetical protein
MKRKERRRRKKKEKKEERQNRLYRQNRKDFFRTLSPKTDKWDEPWLGHSNKRIKEKLANIAAHP